MFHLLKKFFDLRDKANPDYEKPFLEHLEDLRLMVTRIVVTLLVATLVCWVFRNQLMDILRRPVDDVWVSQQTQLLPTEKDTPSRPLDLETWEKTKKIASAVGPLDSAEREAFFNRLEDPNLHFHVDSYLLYRAALQLPEDQRDAFLASTGDPEMRRQVAALLKSGADPLLAKRDDLRMMGAFKPTEGFMLSMKLAFFAGIVVSFPLLLYFILQFVLPGLHKKEKNALFPAMAIGFALFLIGVCFAYFVVLPRVLIFFHDFSDSMGIVNEWRIGYYISFATQFTLIFGLSFELPVVVMTLVKIGILNWEMMRHTRGYAVLAIVVIAAVITPTPDAFTLCLLAVPMILLYEICIWLSWWDHKKHPPDPDDHDDGDDDTRPDTRPHLDAPLPYETEKGENEDTGDSGDDGDPGGDSGDDPDDPYAPYDDPYYESYGADDDIDPFTEYQDPHAAPETPETEGTDQKSEQSPETPKSEEIPEDEEENEEDEKSGEKGKTDQPDESSDPPDRT